MKKVVLLLLSLLLLVSCGAEEIKPEAKPPEAQIVETPAPKVETPEKEEEKASYQKPEIKNEEKPIAPPEEKHEPSPEPIPAPIVKEEKKTLCTISVTCEKAVGKKEKIPTDGVILNTAQVEFTEGESVFDVLKRCLEENNISLKYREDTIYKSIYVEGAAPRGWIRRRRRLGENARLKFRAM